QVLGGGERPPHRVLGDERLAAGRRRADENATMGLQLAQRLDLEVVECEGEGGLEGGDQLVDGNRVPPVDARLRRRYAHRRVLTDGPARTARWSAAPRLPARGSGPPSGTPRRRGGSRR